MKSKKERNIPIWAKGVRPTGSTDSALSKPGGCAVAVLVQVSIAFWVIGSVGLFIALCNTEGNEKPDFLTPAAWVGVGFLSFICYLLFTLIDAVVNNDALPKDQPPD